MIIFISTVPDSFFFRFVSFPFFFRKGTGGFDSEWMPGFFAAVAEFVVVPYFFGTAVCRRFGLIFFFMFDVKKNFFL